LSVRKIRIAVESTRQFVGVEARRHFKRSVKPNDEARFSPPSTVDRGGAFFRAPDNADHLADDKFFPPFKPREAKASF